MKKYPFLPAAGLNVEQIRTDMNDPAIAKLIQQNIADTKTLNVRKIAGILSQLTTSPTLWLQGTTRIDSI